ncbi:N-acetylmuramoyl-L-alanine amidase [Clostridium sp. BNL1100]|uniref:N-acetylmuramoyl-L-alanine amidase family protein n=1 Tax=Clostridium sp. BNL1100 TaxID=755731 RepID=UPI00024A7C2C|nr:N-acetylmuramoyl-L-alanine amidase [Clostridium sp. BNL1100]AEY67993.1 N-acetylmuramoyl-L-alanine amidase [Clostridium sp. BNL1100]
MMRNIKIYVIALAVSIILGYGVANHVDINRDFSHQVGKEVQTVSSTPLKDLTVCIDPGHGKTTGSNKETEPIAPNAEIQKAANASGTMGVATGISEASLNLTVAKKLRESLKQNGAKVIMVRETEVCGLTNVERAKFWNSSKVDLTIRIHGNGTNDSSVSGVLMMIPGNKYIKDKELLKNSRKAGELVLAGVIEHTKAKSRGIQETSELTGFNWSRVPVILLEMGFMTNPEEDKRLNTDDYQNKMVAGITEGLIKYVKEK